MGLKSSSWRIDCQLIADRFNFRPFAAKQHRLDHYLRTDNASWSFFRPRIVELFAFRCDNASSRLVAAAC
jgi:hypothetical protein